MARMEFHHHKYALTLTILLVAVIGVLLGMQIDAAAVGTNALLIMTFGFVLLSLVLSFIMISVLLRTREELHQLHAELDAKLAPKAAPKKAKK